MSKVNIKVKEMVDATVSFISLVNRPANRIPFRVTKAEDLEEGNNMLKLLRRKEDVQKSEAAPTLAGIVVAKANAEAFAPTLAEAGFSVEDMLEIDGSVVFKQYDFSEGNVDGYKLNDNISVLVADMPASVVKAYDGFAAATSTDFDEVHAEERFFPGVNLSVSSLMSTLGNIVDGPFEKDQVSEAVANALSAFSGTVQSLVDSLPASVFQLENMDFVMFAEEEVAEKTEEVVEEVEKADDEDKDEHTQCPEGMVYDAEKEACVAIAENADVAEKEEVEVAKEADIEVSEEVVEEVVETEEVVKEEEVTEEVVEEVVAEEVAKEEDTEEVVVEEVVAPEAGDVDAAGYVIKDDEEAAIAAEIAAQIAEQEVVEKEEEVVAEEDNAVVAEEEEVVKEEVEQDVVKSDNGPIEAVPAWVELLTSKFEAMEAAINGVKEVQVELAGRVEGVETVAKAADAKVSKTVLGTSLPEAVKATKQAEPKKDLWEGVFKNIGL